MPHSPQPEFKFDPLNIPNGVAILWTPHFAQCVPTQWRNSFFNLFDENVTFRKNLESPLIFVYYVHTSVIDSLYCILFCLSQHIVYSCYIPILLIIFLPSLCVDMSDISVLCLIVCCMTAPLCVIACCLSVWVAHISPYLQPSGFDHFLPFGSYICKCETWCVFVSLTELVVRSRV